MKSSISLIVLMGLFLFPCLKSVGDLKYGYSRVSSYPYEIEKQEHNNWCVFATIASYPGIDLPQCLIATDFVTTYGEKLRIVVICLKNRIIQHV